MPNIVCPTCATKLEIDDDMIGQDVQCGSCQQIFKAETETKRSSRRGETDEDEKPRKSKYRKDEDDEDERPSRRHSAKASEDDEDNEDDYEDRPSRRRRSQQGGGQGLGIASLVLGILGLLLAIVMCWCCPLVGLPLPVIAIITGVMGLKTPGKGMAIGGIVTGGVGLVLCIVSIILSIMSAGFQGAMGAGAAGGPNNNPPGRIR